MSIPSVPAARWSSKGSPRGSAAASEDEQLGLGREQAESLRVALLDLARHRLAAGKAESAGELGDVPGARQLEQRERVPMALRDDLLADRRIQRPVHALEQQRARVAVAEPVDGQLGKPGEDVVADARARGAHERDPLGEEAAGDEAEHLRRRVVEPLRVVDDADERLLLGDLGKQRQRGEPDEEAVGRRAGAPAEHGRERVPLRHRQPIEAIQHRRAELVETAVGELHLRLDALGSRDPPAVGPVGHVAKQRLLPTPASPRSTDDPAPARKGVAQEPSERLAFGPASEEPARARASLDSQRRLRRIDPPPLEQITR